ncbi:coniferyl-aldehyde dehydrogenase [Shewanella sp. Choline-02u-19]|uniref:coniferyl aldehyde dehydrogenase n=1 Tax=unclassified Shewanella TaxID=196818 RepID=UPI000C331CB8|nr:MULTISPECIES: coniferyl aldehyde dehydrogenase [unclassified Shewanella]PKG57024.1 coniferyl-aldehyde dehydrogenase [Shewanella sp. GutDb-MelDb]PKH54544.1 coniferyl-aldehyde dehydrogenase [Shewanella sp. Bg11-22]PKI28602.1 coniferyl-aldehyde dehydrogenase [Shewanella sp. Choline-02u-19]
MNMPIQAQTALPLSQVLVNQRTHYLADPSPSYEARIEHLKSLKKAILSYQEQLVQALNRDYGHRSVDDSIISDIMPCVNNINYSIKHLKKWMKPSRRHAGLLLAPASIKVQYQPLGVVGIIVPWNFPIMLSVGPLITALAAGNRAMIKLSEFTPETNTVLTAMLASIFDQNHVACIEGEADVAAEFSSLPFDHLLFTGSTTVGRHVMRSAAQHLTPVTLELGGKSPVIVADDIDMDTAVERMIYGKCLNSGQICVAPDYVLVPSEKLNDFVRAYKRKFIKMYGQVSDNKDYGSIINQRQFDRIMLVLEDAKAKGATVMSANDEAINIEHQKVPTQLITDATDDMLLLQDEIFGPLLPVIPYNNLQEAISYINQRPRPLALYLMSFDKNTQQQVMTHTHSGGVCINETVFHVAAEDAPFGGVGPSGMGHYHGKEGFQTFSHAKTILKRGKYFNTGKLIHPPYGGWLQTLLVKFFLR